MSYILKDIIEKVVQKEQLWKIKLLTAWPTVMGMLSSKVSCEKIEGDTIILGVEGSCWMQEIYLLSPTIINKINQSLDQPRIKKLFLKQKKQIAARSISCYKKPASEHKASAVTFSAREKAALTRVHDTHLHDVLSSFLVRCYQERFVYEK